MLSTGIEWSRVLTYVGDNCADYPALDFIRALGKEEALLSGGSQFAEMNQRASRWTLLLLRFIVHRMTLVIDECKKTPEYGKEVPLRYRQEVALYRGIFLPQCASFCGAEKREGLTHLLAAFDEYSADDFDVNKLSIFPAPEHDFKLAVRRAHDALARDVLQITWDYIDPKHLEPVVLFRLNTTNVLAGNPAATSGEDVFTILHSATFAPLYDWHQAKFGSAPFAVLTLDETKLLYNLLKTAVYTQLPKWEAGIIDASYYLLPFVLDFKHWRSYWDVNRIAHEKNKVPVGTNASSIYILENTLVERCYTCLAKEVRSILTEYLEMLKKSNEYVPLPASRLSPGGKTILCRVIEPSLNVIRRFDGIEGVQPEVKEFCTEVRQILSTIIDTEMKELIERTTKTQIEIDIGVVMTYIEKN
ncbi:hypothetical protein AGDE_12760 [Angomonas deanei]|uniref:Uncharacterized protein n=1 Tax=Angomonas deanei TaxID=59799 RepID=A0A7G2CAX4_9TRYP|nr:hypothetical protein AGDE_12760 [Angomonas deanei]CAD2216689.1 hypothetical protein, conserved [Angomonas deanei]|eukprot:EPY23558.1 hypothetical protein AGDE_12760 [Angomonas deanei]